EDIGLMENSLQTFLELHSSMKQIHAKNRYFRDIDTKCNSDIEKAANSGKIEDFDDRNISEYIKILISSCN
ncbi:MAG: hypothetical protein MHPSP_002600, partial [Paramarteilia canceri]